MSVIITLKRSSDRISRSEILIEFLQYILYHRRQVPEIVSTILHDPNEDAMVGCKIDKQSIKIDRFRIDFSLVCQRIRNLFRTVQVTRMAIVIGSSPSVPTDIYFVQFMNSDQGDGNINPQHEPETNPLTDAQRRHIVGQLIDQGVCYRRDDHEFGSIKRATKIFLLIEGKLEKTLNEFDPRPDLDLRAYCRMNESKMSKRRSVNWITILVKDYDVNLDSDSLSVIEETVSNADGNSRIQDEGHMWFQFKECIAGFDE